MTMETFFITLFIIAFSIALGIIAYTLYDMSKKISSTSTEETFDEKFKAIQEELNDTFENLSNKVLVDQSDKSLEKMKKSLNELLRLLPWEFNCSKKSLESFEIFCNNDAGISEDD